MSSMKPAKPTGGKVATPKAPRPSAPKPPTSPYGDAKRISNGSYRKSHKVGGY